jgi:hypothetical protein
MHSQHENVLGSDVQSNSGVVSERPDKRSSLGRGRFSYIIPTSHPTQDLEQTPPTTNQSWGQRRSRTMEPPPIGGGHSRTADSPQEADPPPAPP